MNRQHVARISRWLVTTVICLGWVGGPSATSPTDQQQSQEQTREAWQRVPDIFNALGIHPGAVVADVGAGPGFFTERLSKAVGPAGRVLAVDINANALGRLRDRLRASGLTNVDTIQGQPDDPKLPAATLDAALIVNAYHEMVEYNAMLTRIRAALKPSGHLVIVEPISESRRDEAREAQTRQHEIAPGFVQREARAAGFRIVGFEDPFTEQHGRSYEYLLVLAPSASMLTTQTTQATPAIPVAVAASSANDTSKPELRISSADFTSLQRAGRLILLDVRDPRSYAKGHIPGARLAPLSELRNLVDELKGATVPVVAYCDCPAEESSARAVLYLRKQGITNVRALVGGWDRWLSSGGAVVAGPASPGATNELSR